MKTLTSMIAPAIVIRWTAGTTSVDKVGVMTTASFQS